MKSEKNCEKQGNSWLACDWLASGQPTKCHVSSTWWKLKSQVPEDISWLIPRLGQLSRWPVKVHISSFLYLHYKSPHFPRNCKENFREKTLKIHLRVRDCTPTISWEALDESILRWMQLEPIAGSRKLVKTRLREAHW